MIFVLGMDTTVSTGLPTPTGLNDKSMKKDFLQLHAAWGNENIPDEFYFLPDPRFQEYSPDKPYSPKGVWGTPWSQMTSKARESAELELTRLVLLLSTGLPRHWNCPKCGTVQLYPPPSSFVQK